MIRARIMFTLAALMVVAAACSSTSDAVTIDDPWGRPSPTSTGNAAFYMAVTGGETDDRIASASSPSCEVTELHETTMQDGVMSMQEQTEGIPIPAGSTVMLEPGGLHVMCIGVQKALVAGETVNVQLEFENAGAVTVQAEIREQ
jgi:copper(I)-binding protein